MMLGSSKAFSGFSVVDVEAARVFYGDVLGLGVNLEDGMLSIRLGSGAEVLAYPKPDHQPATFTILNFPVHDIEEAVDELHRKGVTFEVYDQFDQDDKGINREEGGPPIAWFTDPSGNILSVLEV